MSELINTHDSRATIRWKLLTSASVLALMVTVSSANLAKAEDSDRPQVWIELGGQYTLLDDAQQRYAPPFLSPAAVIPFPSTLPSPLPAQKPSRASVDYNGKISFEPEGSDWVFSAAVRYGRSSRSARMQKTLTAYNTYSGLPSPAAADFVNSKANEQQTHAILDFMAGKDVGLGMLGSTSVLSGGVRIAQFTSGLSAYVNADPDYHLKSYHDLFKGTEQARHNFRGIGPAISWDASAPVAGNTQDGEITFDWGVNAAMLFGRRATNIHHQTSQCHAVGTRFSGVRCTADPVYNTTGSLKRSHTATVPNVGGYAGFSMRYANAKVSFGYRVDEFFGAIDGGIATAKNENRGFQGPYASISIGVGD